MRALVLAATLAVGTVSVAQAAPCVVGRVIAPCTIEGHASVTDGDTVKVADVRIRLKGVDAPEPAHMYGSAATEGMKVIAGD